MSPLASLGAILDRVAVSSLQQAVLRALVLVSAVGVVGLVRGAGGSVGPLVTAAVVGLALIAAAIPDSSAPLFLVLVLGWLWWAATPDAWSGWSLGATALLTVVHVACTLCGYGPPALRVPPRLVGAWVGRGGFLLASAALVWVAAGVLAGLDLPSSTGLIVVALALVAGRLGLLVVRILNREAAES